MKDAVDAQLRDQQAGFRKDRSAQTKLQHYGSSSNNQLSGNRHCTSTSLIMKRRLTVWIREHYGNYFDTTEFLRRLSTLSGTHTTDYNAKSCMEYS
uniref:HTH_48 domain-containing protein n=1 Tax=Schistosoma curassoni TaxID=6186 RepID=A0A183KGZ5_9TREM